MAHKKLTGIDPKDATHNYIALARCGCAVAVTVDLKDDSTADDVRDYLRRGYSVNHVTHEEFRAMKFGAYSCGREGCPIKAQRPQDFACTSA